MERHPPPSAGCGAMENMLTCFIKTRWEDVLGAGPSVMS